MSTCRANYSILLPLLYGHVQLGGARQMQAFRRVHPSRYRFFKTITFLPCRGPPAYHEKYCEPDGRDASLWAHFGVQDTEREEPRRYEGKQGMKRFTIDEMVFKCPYSMVHAWTRPLWVACMGSRPQRLTLGHSFRVKKLTYDPVDWSCPHPVARSEGKTWAVFMQYSIDYDPLILEIDISRPAEHIFKAMRMRTPPPWPVDYPALRAYTIWYLAFLCQAVSSQRWLASARFNEPITLTCKAKPWVLCEWNDGWRQLVEREDGCEFEALVYRYKATECACGPPEAGDAMRDS